MMTIDQAKQAFSGQSVPAYATGGTIQAGVSGVSAEMTPEEQAAEQRLLDGTWTMDDIYLLTKRDADGKQWLTTSDAQKYVNDRNAAAAKADAAATKEASKPNPVEGLVPYNPQTGEIGYPAESPVGRTSVEQGHAINTYADPNTGILYDRAGKPLPKYLQTFSGGSGGASGGGGGGGASYGSSQQYLDAKTQAEAQQNAITNAMNFQQLLNSQKQQDFAMGPQFHETNRMNDAAINNQQAGQNANFRDFLMSYQKDLTNRERDPFRLGEYLASQSQLGSGASSGIQNLIGAGNVIKPTLGDVYSDPRFKASLDQGYQRMAETPTMGAVGQVRNAYETDPNAAKTFFSQDPAMLAKMFGTPAHAQGGNQTLHEPTYGIPASQLQPGQTPQFLAGEAGPERLTFTPMHHHESKGMQMPHEHLGGDMDHEHDGGMVKYATGGFLHYDINAAIRDNRTAAATTATQDAMNATNVRAAQAAGVQPDASGMYTYNGTRYSGSTAPGSGNTQTLGGMATIYDNSARMNRAAADPLQMNSRGGANTFTGGSLMTPEERAAAQQHLGGPVNTTGMLANGSPTPTPDTVGRQPNPNQIDQLQASPQTLGGPTAVQASAASGLRPIHGTLTEAQGTAVALGKSLRPFGFVPPEALAYLDAGQMPPPSMIAGIWSRLSPSQRALFQSVMTQQGFGGIASEDYGAAMNQYTQPGYRGSFV